MKHQLPDLLMNFLSFHSWDTNCERVSCEIQTVIRETQNFAPCVRKYIDRGTVCCRIVDSCDDYFRPAHLVVHMWVYLLQMKRWMFLKSVWMLTKMSFIEKEIFHSVNSNLFIFAQINSFSRYFKIISALWWMDGPNNGSTLLQHWSL